MNRFIAGNSLKAAIERSKQLTKLGKKPILNYAVEYPKNKKQTNKIYDEYIKMGDQLNSHYRVALKLSSFKFDETKINNIIQLFVDKNIQVIVDAEENKNNEIYQNITNNLLLDFNKKSCNIIKTYQMYRNDALTIMKADINYFNKNKVIMGTKLVRGAYWNSEHKDGHLFTNKKYTDDSYNNGIIELFNNRDVNVKSENIIATHNSNSIDFAIKLNNYHYNTLSLFKFSHLMGMQDIKYNNVNNFNTVYVYIPYGPYLNMVPYLSRRLYENLDTLKYVQYD